MLRVIGTGKDMRFVLPPGLLLPPVVRRRGRSFGLKYWQEQGWRLKNDVMEGYYRTHYRSFKGRIDIFPSGNHEYYLYNPPSELRRHSHWACFTSRGNGLYHVHFAIKAKNVDVGIQTVERILRESLERY